MGEELFDQSVIPLHYRLHFVPEKENFHGQETISLKITAPTSIITLHAKDLQFENISLQYDRKELKPAAAETDKKAETVTLRFSEEIAKGSAVLTLDFSGKYRSVDGFYLSSYEHEGIKKQMLSTQFEAPYARTAFPCFDHPSAKATFQVAMTLDEHLQAVSNTAIAEEKTEPSGKKTVTFHPTPKMSTYLLYLGAGEFETIESTYTNSKQREINLRVLTTSGKSEKGRFSLDLAKKVLGFFEEYFGIDYPLEKLDLIAIPDFGAGAMENWGAVTFREDALMYDAKKSSLANKQRVAEVVAHELAHQWFGNLVTMKWWDDLWLNEAFATFMAFKAVDKFYPELEPWSDFLNHETDKGFSLDALSSSHPIHVPVHAAHEIEEIFDAISYSKGGSVLRMLEAYLGENAFRLGLQNYLTAYSYQNAEANDLWKHLQTVSEKPVEALMNQWLHQIGFPIVHVSLRGEKVSLQQNRFQYCDNADTTLWPVPLTFLTPKGSLEPKLFEEKKGSFILPANSSSPSPSSSSSSSSSPLLSNWLKVNSGQKGFYRVCYDERTLKKLEDAVRKKEVPETDRWGLHADQWALCLAGEVSLPQYLEFTKAYEQEDSPVVLSDVINSLNKFALLAHGEAFSPIIKERQRELYGKIFTRLGWEFKEGEKQTIMQIRSSLISGLGSVDDKEVLDKGRELFAHPQNLHPDLKLAVYYLAARQGDEKTFQQLQEWYRATDDAQEKNRFLLALAGFKDEVLLRKSLDYALASEEVRLQNKAHVFSAVASTAAGKKIIWPWIKENWPQLRNMFGEGMYKMHWNNVIGSLTSLADASMGEEIRAFLTADQIPGTERAIANMAEKMAINDRFLQKVRKQTRKQT